MSINKVKVFSLLITILVLSMWYYGYISEDVKKLAEGKQEPLNFKKEMNTCSPAPSIVFVKTHKTAGTSVQFLLLGYLEKYGLIPGEAEDVMLFEKHIGGYPGPFQRHLIANTRLTSSSKAKIIIGHFRFNREEILPMSRKDTKFVTILRNPLSHFESSFYFYYGRYGIYAKENISFPHRFIRFTSFVCHPEPYFSITKKMNVSYPDFIKMLGKGVGADLPWGFRISNYQSHDLGLESAIQEADHVVEKARELDSIFDLVMITDYYLESLILLKDTLCLDWDGIIGPRVDIGQYSHHEYTTEEKDIIRNINKQDITLYDYFNETLWRKVETYGRARMEKDRSYLQKLLREKNPIGKEIQGHIEKVPYHPLDFISKEQYVKRNMNWLAKHPMYLHREDLLRPTAEYTFEHGAKCSIGD